MIILRGHYFIDLFAGAFLGHYFWILSERYSYFVDYGIFGNSFTSCFPLFNNKCQKCNHELKDKDSLSEINTASTVAKSLNGDDIGKN